MNDRTMEEGLVDAVEETTQPRTYVFDVEASAVPARGKCRRCDCEDGRPRSWVDPQGHTRVEFYCDGCEDVATAAAALLAEGLPLTAGFVVEGIAPLTMDAPA